MMGYTETEIETMMAAINLAKQNLPSRTSFNVIRSELGKTYDFLEGLIVEGRI